MAVTDPVDARLLAALAEVGKTAVHELAAKVGMDPREVAYRLVGLSGSGLPLLVGVESDPRGLWAALAGSAPPASPPSGPYPAAPGPGSVGSGSAGPGPATGPGAPAARGVPSGPYPVHGTPSGPYAAQGTPSGTYPAQGAPSGAYPTAAAPGAYPSPSAGHAVPGTPSGPYPPAEHRPPAPPPDPVMSTWGPPQTASWARGDAPGAGTATAAPTSRTGRIGDVLETQGLEGERLTVQLLEVQDPADYLFGAAGYRLDEGERAVVVHTEISNRGGIPFVSLPDNYLELVTADGGTVTKAPVSLTSRPPHKIGVRPGETAGGHTVYVLPEATRVVAVRWSPRPEPDHRSLTWSVD
ncbi:AsnC family protein [Amycolatopsis arida]|uniref:AsnC family protein n=1 Tax=Amycolatopsis arida TaxID=587909 RepID=UPI000B88C318|nr:AsnC family protein [Amycolatopsis arida]